VFSPDFVVRSRRVVVARAVRAAAIHIRNRRIIGVLDFDDVPAGCPLDDAGDAVVMPGIVDTHVHAGQRADAGLGFETVTRAAAAGGVTTIIDMPFPGAPATTVAALESKRRAAAGRCFVDVGFWGGVTSDNAQEVASLFEAGVFGFKCVLLASATDGFPAISEAGLRTVMPALTRLGATLLAHAELAAPLAAANARETFMGRWVERVSRIVRGSGDYASYLEGRPRAAENEAVALLIRLCREHGTRTHIVHLSSSDTLTPLFHARTERLPMTAETCPHYLYFAADELRAEPATRTAPPIRERENRELLWAALANGLIQTVASDHAFHPADPPLCGISSIQLLLPVVWTSAHGRGYTVDRLVDWLCQAPSQLAGLPRKGQIAVGFRADLVVLDADSEFTVEPRSLEADHRLTPYKGRRLRGVVERTYLGGNRIYSRREGWASPQGELLVRRVS
jgi:allantoinase